MKRYKTKITLVKNNRGCYILDTIKGCSYSKQNKKGCYYDCYAANIANRYGYDFSNPVNRDFDVENNGQLYILDFYDMKHLYSIINQIEIADSDFIRIGEMGDPSEDWKHTLEVCGKIKEAEKPVVIITKHWKEIKDSNLKSLKGLTINTSISALDTEKQREYRLNQYNRLKKHCNSVLRIVSCDFNNSTKEGFKLNEIQNKLFDNEKIIDTVFRPSKNNPLVLNNTIKTKTKKFLKSNVLVSMYNKNTYFGNCKSCIEKCGIYK